MFRIVVRHVIVMVDCDAVIAVVVVFGVAVAVVVVG